MRAQSEESKIRSHGKISRMFRPRPYRSDRQEVIGIGHVQYYAKGSVGYGNILYHIERENGFLVP